jgi:hypothetical protein
MSLAFLRNREVVLGSAATLALSIPSFAGLLPFSTIEVAGFAPARSSGRTTRGATRGSRLALNARYASCAACH